MKRILAFLLFISVTVACFAACKASENTDALQNEKIREPKVKISSSEYTGYLAEYSEGSNLVQIGARIYYCVNSADNKEDNGIYEITNRSIERIWSSKGEGTVYPSLASFDDELCRVDRETGEIWLFDFNKGDFSKKAEGVTSGYIAVAKEFESSELLLWAEHFGEIYNVQKNSDSLCLYKEGELIFDFSDEYPGAECTRMYSKDVTLYTEIIYDKRVHCIGYNPHSKEFTFYSPDEYAGKLFMTEEKNYGIYANTCSDAKKEDIGIFITDMDTFSKTQVYDKPIKEWFLIDKSWVYFTLENMSLWRVSFDGDTIEQVFEL